MENKDLAIFPTTISQTHTNTYTHTNFEEALTIVHWISKSQKQTKPGMHRYLFSKTIKDYYCNFQFLGYRSFLNEAGYVFSPYSLF